MQRKAEQAGFVVSVGNFTDNSQRTRILLAPRSLGLHTAVEFRGTLSVLDKERFRAIVYPGDRVRKRFRVRSVAARACPHSSSLLEKSNKMKLIELHILQSFPVTCLNRDDLGAPKSAVFGGVTRARISSQCLKRAIRMQAKEVCPELFKGERSRLIVEPIKEAATKQVLQRTKHRRPRRICATISRPWTKRPRRKAEL